MWRRSRRESRSNAALYSPWMTFRCQVKSIAWMPRRIAAADSVGRADFATFAGGRGELVATAGGVAVGVPACAALALGDTGLGDEPSAHAWRPAAAPSVAT